MGCIVMYGENPSSITQPQAKTRTFSLQEQHNHLRVSCPLRNIGSSSFLTGVICFSVNRLVMDTNTCAKHIDSIFAGQAETSFLCTCCGLLIKSNEVYSSSALQAVDATGSASNASRAGTNTKSGVYGCGYGCRRARIPSIHSC